MPLNDKARAFLNEQHFAVLATLNADGTPQQTVMWYTLRDDTFVMNTTVTRVKGRNLRRDARISVCVADGYRFVTIAGEAQLVEDQATSQADILELAIRYQGQEQGARQAAEQFSQQQRVSIYLPITQVIVYGL